MSEQNGRVLITGANRGIGLELAEQYHAEGWEVMATARRPDEATELNQLGVEVVALDVASAESVGALAQALEGRTLDLVINNAGIYGPREQQHAGRIDYEAWEEVFRVNTLGPMRVAEAVLASLQRGGSAGSPAKLISVTSLMGSIANNGGGYFAYRSSKSALNSVMAALAKDWREHGVVVAVIHPGWVQTDMGGAGATLTPEESVNGMRQVIASLGLENTGEFRDYDGKEIAW